MVIRVTEGPWLALNPLPGPKSFTAVAELGHILLCFSLEKESMRNFGVCVEVMPTMKVGPQQYLLKPFP